MKKNQPTILKVIQDDIGFFHKALMLVLLIILFGQLLQAQSLSVKNALYVNKADIHVTYERSSKVINTYLIGREVIPLRSKWGKITIKYSFHDVYQEPKKGKETILDIMEVDWFESISLSWDKDRQRVIYILVLDGNKLKASRKKFIVFLSKVGNQV